MKVAHFAHKRSDTCTQETILHKTAKLLIQQAVLAWKAGKSDSPVLQRTCPGCGHPIPQQLPGKVDTAILEHRLADGSIVDVALLVGGIAQAAIEIRVTHAVDEYKAHTLSVPFLELDGYAVIEDALTWKPITDFGGQIEEDSPQAFERDMIKIACYADCCGLLS